MEGLTPRYAWRLRRPVAVPAADVLTAARARGLSSERLARLLAARGHAGLAEMERFLGDPAASLHDPSLLPDAAAFVARVARARAGDERVLVFGDFDADGLTGLAILALTLRRLGLDVATYVPDRGAEGHGLSAAALRHAAAEGRTLIVTADCGTTNAAEIELARRHRIDVLVSDHHRPPAQLPAAAAVINPLRNDSAYPDRQLSGAGVALKCAELLIGGDALGFADLAAIGTVADVAPLVGENRAIVRLGLQALRSAPRPGLAALLETARIDRRRLDPEALAFGVVPRLNAVGRVGDAAVAARLLLCEDESEAATLAAELEAANVLRREVLASALAEARLAVQAELDQPATVVVGPWPAGIIGLLAGRLADERGRPAIVFSNSSEPWRGSARSGGGFDLVAAFSTMGELFERFGGHTAAAGCHMPAANYAEFRRRLADLAGDVQPLEPSLEIDLVLEASEVDYGLLNELARLEPAGAGNPSPLVGIRGLVVGRARAANGGHTQLLLRKGSEVLDGICFGRDELAGLIAEGERLDLVARLASRSFGGFESLQLEIRDLAPPGTLAALVAGNEGAHAVQPATVAPSAAPA